MPHCYSNNIKIDAIAGLTMIIILIWFTNKIYWLIIILALLGCILPELIDLLPQIFNKHIRFNLPILQKIFPWHWAVYSGSIFTKNGNVSNINNLLVVFTTILICWVKQRDLKRIIQKGT